jgi:hypothetical protein
LVICCESSNLDWCREIAKFRHPGEGRDLSKPRVGSPVQHGKLLTRIEIVMSCTARTLIWAGPGLRRDDESFDSFETNRTASGQARG